MATDTQPKSVAVITGAGGMGLAIARRISPGRRLIIGDFSKETLDKTTSLLEDEGHSVQAHTVDVSDAASVSAFAEAAMRAGSVDVVVHTAGISPVMATARKVLEVDLLGTAVVIDAFKPVLAPRGSLVCIASMAGYMLPTPLAPETEAHFATAPTAELLSHASVEEASTDKQGLAYSLAKRANHLRVQAAAPELGQRGCRINSISPGIIQTAMIRQERGASGEMAGVMDRMIEGSAMGRVGTAADVVNLVGFLLSAESSFITGTDFLVDGGSIAAQKWGAAKGGFKEGEYRTAE